MNYESEVQLSIEAREEQVWWRDSLMDWNRKALVNGDPDLTIERDASPLGWGAVCNGVRTGGLWPQSERLLHINCLCSESSQNSSEGPFPYGQCNSSDIHQQDGGYQVPHSVKSYIRTVDLVSSTPNQADQESRTVVDHSDWKLKPEIFQCI